MRRSIRQLISEIKPLDPLEKEHIDFVLQWIDSGQEIFRIAKPAIPDTHLVSYFVIFDPSVRKVLLVDHKKANLLLPTGGHVEKDEHPSETVRRECREELAHEAKFMFDRPIFVTVSKTVGFTVGHTDVSLWYVLQGNSQAPLNYDKTEFHGVSWLTSEEIPYDRSDPHMKRFMNKLDPLRRNLRLQTSS